MWQENWNVATGQMQLKVHILGSYCYYADQLPIALHVLHVYKHTYLYSEGLKDEHKKKRMDKKREVDKSVRVKMRSFKYKIRP